MWAVFSRTLDYTNSTEFCVSCHEMGDNVYKEYQKTAHFRSNSGVRAECADCHVAKSLGPKLLAKVMAAKDLWGHITGVIDTREKFENHRLAMAESVWRKMESTDSRECRSCHIFTAMTIENQKPDAKTQHTAALKDNDTCISCHKGIAHTLPDMSGGYKRLYSELEKVAATENAKADVVYPITEIALYADKELGTTGGKALPATKLTVLERSGDALRVRLEGWQQQGVKPAIYEIPGKRIFQAALSRSLVDQLQMGDSWTDPDTGIIWQKASVEGWVKKELLVAAIEPIWQYGAEMFNANCGTCHKAPAPDHMLANQWIGGLETMKRFVTVDQQQYRFILKYLQMHASDTGGKAH